MMFVGGHVWMCLMDLYKKCICQFEQEISLCKDSQLITHKPTNRVIKSVH